MNEPAKNRGLPARNGQGLLAGLLAFLRSTRVELSLVKWPDRQQTLRLTTIVIAASVLVGVYIGGLDYLFTKLVSLLIAK